MSTSDTPFCFGTAEDFHQPGDRLVGLPSNLTNRDELFSAYIAVLGLPEYFGRNWDAFSECLRDLTWIEEKRVVIVHDGLPALEPAVLNTYIDVLRECVDDWQPGEDHELAVVFPAGAEQAISNCLSAG